MRIALIKGKHSKSFRHNWQEFEAFVQILDFETNKNPENYEQTTDKN